MYKMTRLAGLAALAALIAAGLCGCSQHSPSSTQASGAPPPPPFAQSKEEIYDKQDPCNLLDPKEVEAVLGAALAVPPYRAGNGTSDPRPSGNECVYETANFRYLTLEVTYRGGAQQYSMMGMVKGLLKGGAGKEDVANNVKKNFKLDDGTELTGEWDEATLIPMTCCIFAALRGDQLITIDFTATAATLRQAATLVDGAYKRMDHPLQIDGGGGVAAAKALDQKRPHPVEACSLLTRAEVEAILGALAADPIGHGQNGCTYKLPTPPQSVPLSYDLEIRWRGGYSQWRTDRHVSRIGMAAVMQTAADVAKEMNGPLAERPAEKSNPDQKETSDSGAPGDPAESVSDTGLSFAVVKKDVQVSVNDRFVDRQRAKALVAAVAGRI